MEKRPLASGEAIGEKETFEFTLEPFITGGFMLYIRYRGDCHLETGKPWLRLGSVPAASTAAGGSLSWLCNRSC